MAIAPLFACGLSVNSIPEQEVAFILKNILPENSFYDCLYYALILSTKLLDSMFESFGLVLLISLTLFVYRFIEDIEENEDLREVHKYI